MGNHPIAAGKSSFDLVDVSLVFQETGLTNCRAFLDLACGAGRYTLAAASRLPRTSTIYAVDLWEEGIEQLRQAIASQGITNVVPILADVAGELPIPDGSIDLILMATVLHDLAVEQTDRPALKQASRVLGPGGRLAVIEFKKIDHGPGPPIAIRLDPQEVADKVGEFGFEPLKTMDVGTYTYLSIFSSKR